MQVTSLAEERASAVDMHAVEEALLTHFRDIFQCITLKT